MTTDPARPRLIGRRAESAALTALVDRVAGGSAGGIVVLEGPSGIGKTALVGDAAARAAACDCTVRTARAEPLETGRPLQLLADLLDLRRRDDRPARRLRRMLSELEPTVVGRIEAPALLGEPSPPPGQLLDATVAAAEVLTEDPIVLVADDVHDADRWSMAALRRVATLAQRAPLGLIAAAQPLVDPRLRRAVTAWAEDGAAHLRLGPLGEADALALAEDRHGGPVPAGMAAAVGRAGGVPLLIVELVRSWRPGLQRPEVGLTDAVARLVDGLDEPTRRLVQTVAVVGPVVSVPEVAAVLEVDPLELAGPVEVALARGVIVDTADGLRFGHELVRLAVLGSVPESIRRSVHGRLAEALTAAAADPLRIATHRAESDAPVDPALVDRVVEAAVQRSGADPRRALRLLARAAELDPSRADEIDRLRVEPLAWLGQVDEAGALARRLLGTEEVAERRVRLHTVLADLAVVAGRNAEAVEHLDEAAAEPGAGDLAPSLRAESALARMAGGDPDGALADADAALAGTSCGLTPLTVAERATVALAASVRGRVVAGRHDYLVGLADGERAVEAAEGDPTGAAHRYVPWLLLGLTRLDVDDVDGAADALRRGLGRSLDSGTDWAVPLYQGLSAAIAYRGARASDAVTEAQVGLDLADETGSDQAATWCAALGCLAALQLGDVAEARRFLADAERRVARGRALLGIDFLSLARAAVAEHDGDPEVAVDELVGAWEIFDALDVVACQPPIGPTLVRLALATGDRERAEVVAEELDRVARRVGIGSFDARARHARGLLDQDPAELAAAEVAYADAHRPLDALRARIHRIGALVGRRGARAAVPAAAEVVRAIAAADLPGLEAEVKREYERHGAELTWDRSAPRRGYDGWRELTPTEAAIVELVADGLSNAEIAEARGVSTRTVETHLHRTYRKLGLTSRTQLALEVVARRS